MEHFSIKQKASVCIVVSVHALYHLYIYTQPSCVLLTQLMIHVDPFSYWHTVKADINMHGLHYLCKIIDALIRYWFYFRMLYSKVCKLADNDASIGIKLVLPKLKIDEVWKEKWCDILKTFKIKRLINKKQVMKVPIACLYKGLILLKIVKILAKWKAI